MEHLKEIFDYDPETGIFTWKIRHGSMAKGKRAGTTDKEGYRYLNYQGKQYREHRVAWYFIFGEVPKQLDHINRDKADNCIYNLRPCNDQQNQANAGVMPNNTSGHRGIYFEPERNKWVARMRIVENGKRMKKHIGRFDTAEEAARAYDEARVARFGDFALRNLPHE